MIPREEKGSCFSSPQPSATPAQPQPWEPELRAAEIGHLGVSGVGRG